MKTGQKGIDLIKQYEGLRLVGYLCPANIPTVGYGTTGPNIRVGMRITEGEAEEFLRNSLTSIEQGLSRTVTVPLNQNEFDALVSFAYNVGSGALYSSTLLKLLNSGVDKKTVAAEFLRWDKVNGKPVLGLTRRRKSEHDLFLTPLDPTEMTSSIFAVEDTWLKREPLQASELPAEKKLFVPKGSAHQWDSIEQIAGEPHYKVHLTRHPEQPWWFWPSHFKIVNEGHPLAPTPPASSSTAVVGVAPPPVLNVPYYSQLDNSRDPYRTCFSSSCAMMLKYLKPKSIKSDDEYIDVVFNYGDTTDASVQLKALKHFGVTAQFKQTGSWSDLTRLIRVGIPIPIGFLHKGRVDAPTGGGHWLTVIGVWKNYQGVIVNDPFGELDLVGGTYINTNGKALRYSQKNLGPRWLPEGAKSGWYIEATSW